MAFPDGITIDSEDYLWMANLDGRISRFDPDGRVDGAIALPTSRITSCGFAGPRLDGLFVTAARLERGNEPMAGALFELDAACPDSCRDCSATKAVQGEAAAWQGEVW